MPVGVLTFRGVHEQLYNEYLLQRCLENRGGVILIHLLTSKMNVFKYIQFYTHNIVNVVIMV